MLRSRYRFFSVVILAVQTICGDYSSIHRVVFLLSLLFFFPTQSYHDPDEGASLRNPDILLTSIGGGAGAGGRTSKALDNSVAEGGNDFKPALDDTAPEKGGPRPGRMNSAVSSTEGAHTIGVETLSR